jgi:hypothetical protein
MRRWRGLRLRRGAYYGPLSSPVPPQWPPPVIRPAGPLKFGARLLPSRRRWNDPGWGQAGQGQAWPSYIKPAGSRPRWGPKLAVSRGRRFDPPWTPPAPPVPPQLLRPAGPLRFGARPVTSRGRRFDPPWPQGNQGQAWPSFTRPAGTRARYPHCITSHGRRFDPPWPQGFIPAPQLDPNLLAGRIKADNFAGAIT